MKKSITLELTPDNYESVIKTVIKEYGKLLYESGEFDSSQEASRSIAEDCIETLEEIVEDDED